MNLKNKLKNGVKIGLTTLVGILPMSCGTTQVDRFTGDYRYAPMDTTLSVDYNVYKKDGKVTNIEVIFKDAIISRFSGEAAESLYTKILPEVLENYGPGGNKK